LTQRAGHFAQVIQHGSPQRLIIGIMHEATHVGSLPCQNKAVNEKPYYIHSKNNINNLLQHTIEK
jgi:hypothetical protein